MNSSKSWDAAADAYDESATTVTEKFANVALELTIKEVEGLKILDIATGTGSWSILAAKRLEPMKGIVLATDFSEKMIEVLDRKIKAHGLKNITAKVMDGQALEIDDNNFDLAYSIFGIMFFPDRLKGFKEMLRVLKKNGKAVLLTWTTQNPIANIMMAIMKKLNMGPPSGNTPVLSDPDKFKSEMSEAGFSEVEIQTVKLKITITYNTIIPFFKSRFNEMLKLTGKTIDEFNEIAIAVINETYPVLEELEFVALMGVGTKTINTQ